MLKKIKIYIESHIDNLDEYGKIDGESEINKSSYTGTLRSAGSEISLAYKEIDENGTVNCSITLSDATVTVRRNGVVVSTMVFDENEIYKTLYTVPPYQFDVEIKTKKIESSLTERGGTLLIVYDMNIGGAEKSAQMKITASEDEKL